MSKYYHSTSLFAIKTLRQSSAIKTIDIRVESLIKLSIILIVTFNMYCIYIFIGGADTHCFAPAKLQTHKNDKSKLSHNE